MSLEELLNECQQQHMVLLTNKRGQAALYAPNVKVSRQIRAAVRTHRQELGQLLARSDSRVCVNPRLHASYMWDVCYICQKLDAAIAPQRRQRVA